ncbi:hypothetical protein HOD20_08305 [archaeon]|jgi:hypothetical protein|nr:hypothetical protein [archaeon]MBT4646886.1 hypothetical protein [archaeon]MBT6822131.1 hypothetical protein [archaeon]MBT7392974.1 hypothetical protein [archaeon]
MPDMEIVNYIKSARELGVHDQEIITSLSQVGWEERKINRMFSLMDSDF